MTTYGYARISRKQQSIERQIRNITAYDPTVKMYQEAFTGTTSDRPEWCRLLKRVKAGDTIIFDSVSRMSRNAEEGIEQYFELYNKGVNMVFLKERHIDTDAYREALKSAINIDCKSGDTDTDVLIKDIMNALNKFARSKASADIKKAFEQSQKEVDDLRQRTKEGIKSRLIKNQELIDEYNGDFEKAMNDKRWGQVGQAEGAKLHVKKADIAKGIIKRHSSDFGGTLNDIECMKLTGLARNTYYKYKRELKEGR